MKRTRQEDASSAADVDMGFRNAPSARTAVSGAAGGEDKLSDRYMAYVTQIRGVNTALYAWMSKQLEVSSNKPLDFSQGVQDAIDYMRSISNRFLSTPGSVLTFGSGDCGQAGHGMDEDLDLMVPYPRPVAALNTKKVVFVACGGLHNAVTTHDGQVFTWGCADDGSLGR